MFVQPSGLKLTDKSECVLGTPIGTSSCQVKQLSLVQIAPLIRVSFLSIKGVTNYKSCRYVSSSIGRYCAKTWELTCDSVT
nr:unnamed protein product [Callosobruchus analis]